jgi:hypothetical protein
MKLGIACCCLVCFMIAGCAFMEMGEERRFVSLDLECELSCLYEFGFSSSNWWECLLWLVHWIIGRWGVANILFGRALEFKKDGEYN